jgi:putative ABC transport system substrate-binding protein
VNSRRFGLIAVIAAAILAAAVSANAQHTGKAPRVGVLVLTPRASVGGAYVDALQHGLRELGYVGGQTIVLDIRWAEGKPDRLAGLALDLVNSNIDVLVTSGTEAIQAARETGRGVPIVMATVVDPVALGFAASLARPGGNLTGLAILSPELIGKRLQLFKETVPSVLKVGAIWNPANEANVLMLAAAETAARALGIELLAVPVRRPDQLRPAFAALVDGRARGLVVFEDSMLVSHTQEIVGLAARSRLPAMYAFRSLVEAGGLMSYGPHLLDLWHRAAAYVDKILKGARPGDLPVEQPTRFELVVNVRTAKALGLTIPQSILLRANHVIE